MTSTMDHAYTERSMPRGVLGLDATMFKEYLRFIANRRCQQIGVDPLFDKADNPTLTTSASCFSRSASSNGYVAATTFLRRMA